MPYRRNTYDLVIDSSFTPFSMQELLTPFVMYKDSYDKQEAAYEDLTEKADKFKYLSETLPEGSKSRAIYEGYANELSNQAADLAKNGLSMSNRRALTNLKRRYQGEIGRLDLADTAMREQMKLRNAARANGQNLLYAEDNLNIDQFLDNNNPNLYTINADELRKEAVQYATAASGRVYGNTQIQNVNKYFQEIIQQQGYSPEVLAAWRQNLESIPEFNQAVNDILEARQVNGNLTGRNYEVARQNVINGIMEGAGYQEKRSIQQNPGVLTAAQAASNALGWANHNESVRQHDAQIAMSGYYKDENGQWQYDPERDVAKKKAEAIAKVKGNKNTSTGPKPTTRKLKEARSYDGSGNVSPISKNQNTKYGKQISYAEALEKDPSIAQHDPGYEEYYEYFEVNGKVSVVPISATMQESAGAGSGSDDDMQL